MSELRVVFDGLEVEAETQLRDNLLKWLQDLEGFVTHAQFMGSGNGAPNFDTSDVKPAAPAPAAPVAAAPAADTGGAVDPPAGVPGGPPLPVATGIDPATLGAPPASLT
jgi:hypothetical protein